VSEAVRNFSFSINEFLRAAKPPFFMVYLSSESVQKQNVVSK
jgi:hypothetical protein